MEPLSALTPFATADELRQYAWALALVMARILPMFVVLPFTGRNLLPGLLRNVIVIAIGLFVVPTMVDDVKAAQLAGFPILGLILKEALIGLMLGYLVALPFWAVESAGFIIDNQRGASVAATINPITGHDTSPLGIMFNQAFVAFFFLIGGFQILLGLIYDSYLQWPPLSFWPELTPESAEIFVAQLNRLVTLALLLAAPVLIAMFISEVGLALISRFAPQLQVFILAMPIKSGLAMLMLGLYAALFFDYTRPLVSEIGQWVRVLDLGSGGRP